jgi:UDP-N-acetylglucosamine 2-epimerase
MKWFKQIDKLAKKYSEYEWVLPVHPNPNVLRHAENLNYVEVVDPLEHEDLLELLCSCRFVITDSGGIQEEAAFLRVPCIVCREKTERTEGIGSFSFFAYRPKSLKYRLQELKDYKIDEKLSCPYGNGNSAVRVVNIIEKCMENNR